MTYIETIAATLSIDTTRARMVQAYLLLTNPSPEPLPPEVLRREYEGGIAAAIDSDPAGAAALADSYDL